MDWAIVLGLVKDLIGLGEAIYVGELVGKHHKNIYNIEKDIQAQYDLGQMRNDRRLEDLYNQLKIEKDAFTRQLQLKLSEVLSANK